MKIELVGTGSVRAQQLSACTLIDNKILIDAGSGIIKRLKKTGHKIENIENCIITHLHGDHFADIPFLLIDRTGDFAVLDMCFMEAKKGHMGLDDIIKISKMYPNKKFATTHMNEDARKEAKEKNIENLIVPDDGRIIEL